jgi:hypothetical protein
VACAVGPSVTQVIFHSKAWFFGIYLKFQRQKSLKNQSLPHSEPQILPNKVHYILLIKIFPATPKTHSQFLLNFQLRFNLIFGEEIIQYSRTFAREVQTS